MQVSNFFDTTKLFIVGVLIVISFSMCKKKTTLEADFNSVNTCNGQLPCTVTFINNSVGADSYQWDFGDGGFSTQKSPTHTFISGTVFSVKLIVTGDGKEKSITKVINLNSSATPQCETKGSFACAKKLLSGNISSDQLSLVNNTYKAYYYFKVDTPCVAKIDLTPIPMGGSRLTIDVLDAANENSTKIKTVYGNPGETISFYSGPLVVKEYFIRLTYSGTPSVNQLYSISYTSIKTDSNEVNDNFSIATPMPLGSVKQGTILSVGDQDFFKVYQPQQGVLDVLLTPVPDLTPVTYLQANIYTTASSASKIKSVINLPGETMRFSVGPLDSGIHYIEAKAYNNNSESIIPYKLKVSFDTSDNNELNNSFVNATIVSLNQIKRGTIKSAGDEDFFKIIASSNTTLKILIPSVPSGLRYLKIQVYSDANFSSQLSDNNYQENTAINYTSPYILTAGKEYYIRLTSYYSQDESNSQYTITLKQ